MGPTPIRMVSINCFNHSFTWMIQQRRSNSTNGSIAPFLLVQHSFPNLRSLVSRERWEKGVIRNGQTWQFSLWQWQSNRPMHANHEGWWSMVESSSYIQKKMLQDCRHQSANPEQDRIFCSYASWICWWTLATTMQLWSCCILYPAKMHTRAVDDQHNATTWDQSFAK